MTIETKSALLAALAAEARDCHAERPILLAAQVLATLTALDLTQSEIEDALRLEIT